MPPKETILAFADAINAHEVDRLGELMTKVKASLRCLDSPAVRSKENDDRKWRLPAAWRAVVREGRIAIWQVVADTKLPFESMSGC